MAIRKKILLSFLLIIVIIMGFLMGAIQFYLKPQHRKQAEEETLQILTSKANETGAWMEQRIGEIRMLHQHPACRTLDMEQLKEYVGPLNEMLKKKYGNPGETLAIGGLDGRGWVSDQITIDVSERDYFRRAMTGQQEYVFSQPVVSKSDQNRIFLICYPVLDDEGEIIGFINTSVNLEYFTERIREIDVYGGFPWVMNREGVPYSSNPQELADHNITDTMMEQILKGTEKNPSGVIPLEGESRSLYFTTVPAVDDWILCVIIENEAIYAETNQMIQLILVVCMIAILVAFLLAIVISGSIARPIQELTEHMMEAPSNEEQMPIAVLGTDEVAVLGQTYNQMLSELKVLSEAQVQGEQQKRKAELRALQSQIQPHFLYNTLDTIQWQALEHEAYPVADMVQLLSRIFRISLSDGKEYISMREELSHVDAYLQIQKVRYGDKISYITEVAEDCLEIEIPKLIIQPLVENSIYHGIKPKDENGTISIRVWREKDLLTIQVEDDGIGIPEGKLQTLRDYLHHKVETNHYGLYNVNERLTIAYGTGYQLEIDSKEHQGTTVTIYLQQGKQEEQHVTSDDS